MKLCAMAQEENKLPQKTLMVLYQAYAIRCVTVGMWNAPETGRVLALDVGKRRIGLAISDGLGVTAQGLPTLERTTIREDLNAPGRTHSRT